MSKDLKKPVPVTIEQLQDLMVRSLTRDGWTKSEIRGYITAQRNCGWLRPKCPQWIRETAAMHYKLSIPHEEWEAYSKHPLTNIQPLDASDKSSHIPKK